MHGSNDKLIERLDAFMARANAAYYATHDPFADFTTAPEISQVFGEVLGLWAAVVWEQIGRPDPVVLAEAGPGRGTLMADALRAIGQTAPAFRRALSVHLIETSPRLRALQAERLPDAAWYESLEGLPRLPLILFANEFLDALPIRQFIRRGTAWTERYVGPAEFVEIPFIGETSTSPAGRERARPGLDPGSAREACRERAGEGPPSPSPQAERPLPRNGRGSLPVPDCPRLAAAKDREVVEIGEAAVAFAGELGTRLASRPGAALLIDYGSAEGSRGDTLQAILAGRFADPLREPGSADLTAHVDFSAVAEAARKAGAAPQGLLPQGVFLSRLGLFQRTDRLARSQPPRKAAALIQAAQRLAEPDQMGRLFKVLGLASPNSPALPGFEPDALPFPDPKVTARAFPRLGSE